MDLKKVLEDDLEGLEAKRVALAENYAKECLRVDAVADYLRDRLRNFPVALVATGDSTLSGECENKPARRSLPIGRGLIRRTVKDFAMSQSGIFRVDDAIPYMVAHVNGYDDRASELQRSGVSDTMAYFVRQRLAEVKGKGKYLWVGPRTLSDTPADDDLSEVTSA